MTSRRTFLRQGTTAAAAAALWPPARATRPDLAQGAHVDPAIRIPTDPDVKALALRALDAAKAAGATYADVRLTRTLSCPGTGQSTDGEGHGVGVRALVHGYWGFAASPYWTPEEVTTLATTAVAQARANAAGDATAPVELAPAPAARGHWHMPVQIDPFTLPPEERRDYLRTVTARTEEVVASAERGEVGSAGIAPTFMRQERALATSEGTYVTQTLYRTTRTVDFLMNDLIRERTAEYTPPGYGAVGGGWEVLLADDVPAHVAEFHAEARAHLRLTGTSSDIGRYDVVVDAPTMAQLVHQTLGVPTQLDRAMGYEANATGTSYLDDPLAMVGSFDFRSPLLTLTADRSMPGGLATVQWDDEGVVPDTTTLVKNGVLTDFQTTRESATWLQACYAKQGMPVRSHGCAGAQDALFIPTQTPPNLTLAPGTAAASFDDLVRDTRRGLAVMQCVAASDFQGRTGTVGPALKGSLVRAIVNGRLGPVVGGLTWLYRSTELWKNLVALGGAASAMAVGFAVTKGEPAQRLWGTVCAVPAKLTNMTFIR